MTRKQLRQKGALERLQAQLKSGVKQLTIETNSEYEWDIRNILEATGHDPTCKFIRVGDNKVFIEIPLEDSDIKRIEKEISKLKGN